jgi:hypothetical protein
LIYNAGSNYPSSGGNFGGITIGGSGAINLSPATSGMYSGVVIFQSRDNTRAISFTNGSSSAGIKGYFYAANAQLALSGSAQLLVPVVVNTLTLTNGVYLAQTAFGTDGASGIANTLLGGNLTVFVDNSSHFFAANKLARIHDAINGLDKLLAPYSVSITEVSQRASANLILDAGVTSVYGGAAQGVLGLYNQAAHEITFIENWNWYAGASRTRIGPRQYDFQTTVTHEFGHALGLGHSTNPNSPMYAILPAGVTRRSMTVRDLNIPAAPAGADPLVAPGFGAGQSVAQVGTILSGNASSTAPSFTFGPTGILIAGGRDPLPRILGTMSANLGPDDRRMMAHDRTGAMARDDFFNRLPRTALATETSARGWEGVLVNRAGAGVSWDIEEADAAWSSYASADSIGCPEMEAEGPRINREISDWFFAALASASPLALAAIGNEESHRAKGGRKVRDDLQRS